MAKFKLCSIQEANNIDFHKVLYYQDKLLEDMQADQEGSQYME